MPDFELRMDGHATGLACAVATRLEDQLPFAAFKMCHPLHVHASVIVSAADEAIARAACVDACEAVASDTAALLTQLPPDPYAKERLWPERRTAQPFGVLLRPRHLDAEA